MLDGAVVKKLEEAGRDKEKVAAESPAEDQAADRAAAALGGVAAAERNTQLCVNATG